MGLRFRRSVRLSPLVRLNLSKSGVSLSMGKPGASLNVGSRGVTETVGLPGTGLSYRATGGGIFVLALLVLILLVLSACGAPGHTAHEWEFDPSAPKCTSMTWTQISFEEMIVRTNRRTVQAAAWGCDVFSVYSEAQAKLVNDDGESLWDHERRHVFEQLRHPKEARQ